MRSKKVRIITRGKVVELLADGLAYFKNGREEILLGMHTIVMAAGTDSDTVLAEKLKDSSISIFAIGDAEEPPTALEAIAQGSEIVQTIRRGIGDPADQSATRNSGEKNPRLPHSWAMTSVLAPFS